MAKIRTFDIAEHIKGREDRIKYLLSEYPETMDYKILLLYYWKIFDKIDIPDSVAKAIVERGSEPNSLSRIRRRVLEEERILEHAAMLEDVVNFIMEGDND